MARTIGGLFAEARTLLDDKLALPTQRYSDAELLEAFNGAMVETRAKRPDLWLGLPGGLRSPVQAYDLGGLTLPFPLDLSVYDAFLYYVVGRCELREDTFAVDSRAVTLLGKFVSQLTTVVS